MALVVAAAITAACWGGGESYEHEVRQLIGANLQRGATESQVQAFLSQRGTTQGALHRAREESFLMDAGVSPDAQVIVALFGPKRSGVVVTEQVQAGFIFDDQLRLDSWVVKSVFTGP